VERYLAPEAEVLADKHREVTLPLQVALYVLLAKYNSDDRIKKNEIGRACGTYGKQERCIQGVGGET
jgi:hypothetical protein